jgi:UDP-N-acetylmuramoyl-L-alanyl-D-glutamate--2,6-diaminopimelate ligase
MNKKTILNLLKDFILKENSIDNEEIVLSSITTNLQNAKKSDVVFYKINQTQKSQELFEERLKKSEPGLVIINKGNELITRENCLFIDEANFLIVQKLLCDKFFPDKKTMKLVGVTGTNGKTTTVNLAMQISTFLNHPALSLGTIGLFNSNGVVKDDLESTTPSYVELRKIIFEFQDKYHVLFMEVSSHALVQERLFDLKLDQAAWTSFSQDHLDYHSTMQEYFEAKLKIVKNYLNPNSKLLLPEAELEMNKKIKENLSLDKFEIAKNLDDYKIYDLPLFYRSKFNRSNVELALSLNEKLWSTKLDSFDLAKINTPKGRFSIIEIGETSMAIIDYAHTPDALTNVGLAVKEAFPTHKIIVVFGCGGNRDKTKRKLMGKAVSGFADKIMVTSDNPRDENPEDIILDIIPGITINYEAMTDRKNAIIACLDDMEEGEVLLIAGKGHEEYQEIKGIKLPFSDFEIVLSYKQEMEL